MVQLKVSGICHIFNEVLEENCDTRGFPLVPGHEYPGFVCDVGFGVRELSLGECVFNPKFKYGTSVWSECASFSGKKTSLIYFF